MKRFLYWLKKPLVLSYLHLVFIVSAVVYNYYMQVFCVPSLWSSFLLVGIALYLIAKPLIGRMLPDAFSGILDAVSVWVCFYCVLFLAEANLFGLILIFTGLGLLIYVPHYFLLNILRPYFLHRYGTSRNRIFQISHIVLAVFSAAMISVYLFECGRIRSAMQDSAVSYPQTWMAEKITGMHFKYHTELNYYDGWRPPLHEPLLVMPYQLTGFNDPIDMDLKERLALYRKHFPNEAYKLDCTCAKVGRIEYKRDALWE